MVDIAINIWPIAAATRLGLIIGFAWLRVTGTGPPGWTTLVSTALAEFWLASSSLERSFWHRLRREPG